MEIINSIIANIGPYLEIITSFVGAFALVATLTPNDTDNQIVATLYKVINLFGANVGKASNAE